MSTQKWIVDPSHSEVYFKVKHLMITTVTGYFRKFNLEVDTENEDFSTTSRIEFTADIDSIDTNDAQRDAHLKSADFFNQQTHPQLRFTANQYSGNGDATVSGDLTIGSVTQPITLTVEHGGTIVDAYGQTKAGFTVSGKLSRKAFGLTWNAVTEAGSIVVSDEVRIMAEIQLIKQ